LAHYLLLAHLDPSPPGLVGQRTRANEAYFKGIRAFHSDSGMDSLRPRTISSGTELDQMFARAYEHPCNYVLLAASGYS